MRRRVLAVGGAVGIAIALELTLAPVSARGQADRATPPNLRTLWGEPDLQGIWTDELQTPLQRAQKYAGREFLTDQEVAELNQQRQGSIGRDFRPPAGTVGDVAGAYNAVFNTFRYSGKRTSLVVDPPDGRIPPITADAQKRAELRRQFTLAILSATDACKNVAELKARFGNAACDGGAYSPTVPRRAEVFPYYNVNFTNRADGPEDRSLGERCMAAQLPDLGGFRRVVQSPGFVSIFYDVGQGQGWQRVIPITDAPHLPSHIRQWWGDSRGRWEGKTLVVDVTNFTAKTNFRESRENLHLVERWTRVDPTTLEYAVTIEDPTTWTKPWTVKQEYKRQDEQANRIYDEPRCHEGNFGMVGMLKGARDAETAFAEGRGPDPASVDLYSTSGFFRRADDDAFVLGGGE